MDEPEKTKCTSCRCKKLPSQLVAGKTWCIVCAESWKRYRAKNPEIIKEVSKKYDAEHREEKRHIIKMKEIVRFAVVKLKTLTGLNI